MTPARPRRDIWVAVLVCGLSVLCAATDGGGATGAAVFAGVAGGAAGRAGAGATRGRATADGCVGCHEGIEDMHPSKPLSCVDCHGGDGKATTAEAAHVRPTKPPPPDERVAPIDFDLEYRRFVNPTDLRVAQKACGGCHGDLVADVRKSLHGTTAGHLSDGLYENGVVKKRGQSFSIFPVSDDAPGAAATSGTLKELPAVPGFQPGLDAREIPTHYRDVVRKNCMQCHLWSRGRAVRGRLGMDGDYRSEGCAACHITYSDSGFSQSADAKVNHKEPGHPLKHEMTTKVPTETCTRCHYGDASIGLAFRGMAQLVPGQPAGPDVPGTTSKRLNGTFYTRDDLIAPPDIHHERGMQCVDCHTGTDVMGDGRIRPVMDRAVEIECASCHGTFDAVTDLKTRRGGAITNLERDHDGVYLVSKGTGARRRVKQAKEVCDPRHFDFNPRAREAMTSSHAKLECYACHASWTVNFFGFHFDRNESFTQLDLISGKRTPGRVNTLEKVFASFKHFTIGLDDEGRYAPYLVGFSTFCTAHDETGRTTVDQQMPRTAAGLSGMTMIHHQPHTTRREGRACAECHRSGATLGLGSGNFDLGRGLLFAASKRGFATVAADRKSIDKSLVLSEVRADAARDVAVVCDPVSGAADAAYVATGEGLSVVSLASPAFPEVRLKLPFEGGLLKVVATDRKLYAAAGPLGVVVFDLKDRLKPEVAARIPCRDARGLALASLKLFVADGAEGLTTVDVADPANPVIISNLKIGRPRKNPPPERGAEAVAAFFQYGRPVVQAGIRSRARQIVAVGGRGVGLHLIDATEPGKPYEITSEGDMTLAGIGRFGRIVGLRMSSKFDLGSTGGGIPSFENDYCYVATRADDGNSFLHVLRITDPDSPKGVGLVYVGAGATGLALLRLYNPPFLLQYAVVPTETSLRIVDVTRSEQGVLKASLDDAPCSGGVAVEAMPLDRMITEEGVPLKDVAHENARYVDAQELRRILRAQIPFVGPPAREPSADPAQPEDQEK